MPETCYVSQCNNKTIVLDGLCRACWGKIWK